MMEEINWAEAPEGTTHVITRGVKHFYRKVTEEDVYAWANNKWDNIPFAPKDWFRRYAGSITERPKEPGEAVLPDGIEWPQWATHYNKAQKLFFCLEGFSYRLQDQPHKWIGGEGDEHYFNIWAAKFDNIVRFAEGNLPAGQVIREQPKPIPKKPIGWWT